jgi:hypothetical protein
MHCNEGEHHLGEALLAGLLKCGLSAAGLADGSR